MYVYNIIYKKRNKRKRRSALGEVEEEEEEESFLLHWETEPEIDQGASKLRFVNVSRSVCVCVCECAALADRRGLCLFLSPAILSFYYLCAMLAGEGGG